MLVGGMAHYGQMLSTPSVETVLILAAATAELFWPHPFHLANLVLVVYINSSIRKNWCKCCRLCDIQTAAFWGAGVVTEGDSRRADEIYRAAAKLRLPERATYLLEVCGSDIALRQQVEALLPQHDQAAGQPTDIADVVGDEVPSGDTTSAIPLTDQGDDEKTLIATLPQQSDGDDDAPRQRWIGPYQLLEQLGEGGMGTVWRAEQTSPVRRTVAIKVIKGGLATGNVIARFEQERQALALMDHPNIAKVLDAGTTEDNQPYFVMELVESAPVTKFCDSERLSPRQRLELFIPICKAIQHAHQKGIIHRDIKPSNVLVALSDGKPIPKVIDFGVAKAMGQPLPDQLSFTGFGTIVGTLEYMSPEQADPNERDIDTRADVYSLGVLLYELLTGSTPLNRKSMAKAAFTEMLKLIQQKDPPPPSDRLASERDDLASISAVSRTDPSRLARLVRGELDWIVMRALEKERDRRYPAAVSLVRDIERFLREEPVEQANAEVNLTLRKTQRERQEARDAKKDAEEVSDLMIDLLRRPRRLRNKGEVRLQVLLDRAIAKLDDNFKASQASQGDLYEAFGETYVGLGLYPRAVGALEKARNLRIETLRLDDKDTLDVMAMLAEAYRDADRLDDAVVLWEDVCERRRRVLGEDHRDVYRSLEKLARCYNEAGRDEESAMLANEVLQLRMKRFDIEELDSKKKLDDLVSSMRDDGHQANVISLLEHVLRRQRDQLGDRHDRTRISMQYLTNLYLDDGRTEDAIGLFEEDLAFHRELNGDDHADTLESMFTLAEAYNDVERWEDARKLFQECLDHRQTVPGPQNDRTLATLKALAGVLADLDRLEESVMLRQRLLTQQRQHQEEKELPATLSTLGRDLQKLRRYDEADAAFRECYEIRRRLERNDWHTFWVQVNIGDNLIDLQRYEDAERLLLAGYEGMRLRQDDISAKRQYRLIEAIEKLVRLYDAWQRGDEATFWREKLAE